MGQETIAVQKTLHCVSDLLSDGTHPFAKRKGLVTLVFNILL